MRARWCSCKLSLTCRKALDGRSRTRIRFQTTESQRHRADRVARRRVAAAATDEDDWKRKHRASLASLRFQPSSSAGESAGDAGRRATRCGPGAVRSEPPCLCVSVVVTPWTRLQCDNESCLTPGTALTTSESARASLPSSVPRRLGGGMPWTRRQRDSGSCGIRRPMDQTRAGRSAPMPGRAR